MLSKEILLKIEWKDMDTVILTNSKGDTYTSKSEELQDFLHGEPPPPVQSDSGAFEILQKHWRFHAEEIYKRSYKGVEIPPTYAMSFIPNAMQEYASLKTKELREALEEIIEAGKDFEWGKEFWAVKIATKALNNNQ